MKKALIFIIPVLVIAGILWIVAGILQPDPVENCPPENLSFTGEAAATTSAREAAVSADTSIVTGIPRMLEIGSVGCRSCASMVPVMEALERDYAGKLSVEFYDIQSDTSLISRYNITSMPTHIFLDADGNEVARLEGCITMEEIEPVLARLDIE